MDLVATHGHVVHRLLPQTRRNRRAERPLISAVRRKSQSPDLSILHGRGWRGP